MRPETALLLLLAPAALAQTLCPLTPCSAVHVLLVRGTNEPYPGLQQPIAEAVCAGWDCTWASVEYPAVFHPSYCASVEAGVASTLRAVTDYATRCPDARIVLSGFSQGGQAVGDLLGGGGGEFVSQGCVQEANEGISPETFPGDRIAAALVWGSPRHVANQSYNLLVGARLQSGFPREGAQLASLNRWSSVLRDYCNFDDPACARGTSWDAHENYGLKYADDAAQFVRFKTC